MDQVYDDQYPFWMFTGQAGTDGNRRQNRPSNGPLSPPTRHRKPEGTAKGGTLASPTPRVATTFPVESPCADIYDVTIKFGHIITAYRAFKHIDSNMVSIVSQYYKF